MISISINGVEARIRNLNEIGFKTSFRERGSELELNVDSIICVNETKKQLEQWKAEKSPFNLIPATINYGTLSFDYVVDLNEAVYRTHEVEVKLMKRKGTDTFFQQADGLTFEYLKASGVNFPTINIPYVIVPDNQVEVGLTLALGIYSMSVALADAIKELAYIGAEFTGALALSPGLAVSAGLKLVAQIVYTTALVIALIEMIKRFRELIFPKIRYFKGIRVFDLLATSITFLGYSFNSNLLSSLQNLTILPVPLQKTNESIFDKIQDQLNQSFTKGYPTSVDSVPTLGDLIASMELMFNAKTKVTNGVVNIERWNYWQNIANLDVNSTLNLQDSRTEEFKLNTDEAWKRYFITYQEDYNDIHTLDNFEPMSAEYGARVTNLTEQDLDTLKGLVSVNIPYSLGIRKNQFNYLESLAFILFGLADSITGLNTQNLIEKRLGVLQISQQFYGNTKLLWCDNTGRQPKNYLNFIKASALWNNYHQINRIEVNGWEIHENMPFPLRFEQFENILTNNFIKINGIDSEILDLEFIPNQSKAIISYRLKNDYANEKISTFVVNA